MNTPTDHTAYVVCIDVGRYFETEAAAVKFAATRADNPERVATVAKIIATTRKGLVVYR